MGRELKRVPVDFDWPLETVWAGYLNPFYKYREDCPACDGSGYSQAARDLRDKWYGRSPFCPEDRGSVPFSESTPEVVELAERNIGRSPEFYGGGLAAVRNEIARLCELFNSRWCHHLNESDIAALIGAGRLKDFTHVFVGGTGWVERENFKRPSPEQVNRWSIKSFGHDSINCHVVICAEVERLGLSCNCDYCNGDGEWWNSQEAKRLAEEWQCQEPPKGPGFQIWETVSDGSPISPVFATAEELAAWMAGKKWGADSGSSYETWMKFIKGPGWAPSLAADENGIRSGVEAGLS